jgi:hypothetical protein
MAANSFIFGTVIIATGFIWLFVIIIVGSMFEQTMVAFFYTISGLIFWAVSNSLNSKSTAPEKKVMKSPSPEPPLSS